MRGDEATATVDEYLGSLADEQREPLQALRTLLLRLIPGGTENISFQIPVFVYRGRGLVGMSASRHHCSLHLMSPALAQELDGSLLTGKIAGATIHFTKAAPLDEQTVRLVVERRIAQREER